MTRLDNKIAIVTGGAGGIGSGIVRAYVKENAKLFLHIYFSNYPYKEKKM